MTPEFSPLTVVPCDDGQYSYIDGLTFHDGGKLPTAQAERVVESWNALIELGDLSNVKQLLAENAEQAEIINNQLDAECQLEAEASQMRAMINRLVDQLVENRLDAELLRRSLPADTKIMIQSDWPDVANELRIQYQSEILEAMEVHHAS